MDSHMACVLFRQDQIRARVAELGRQIADCYRERASALTIVPVLAGAIIFLADLVRELPLIMRISLVQLSAYPGAATRARQPQTVRELQDNLAGRDVLIVDDILDTGGTLREVQRQVYRHQPLSVRTAVLLRKRDKAPADLVADFVGFDIDDQFVVGYGLDFADLYRNYPHIAVLRPEFMR
jgi:hypoxanthine phosphoribosyltransferase